MSVSSLACAEQFIERESRYEINWSTGKVRFYGVGKLDEGEDSLRAAEQRAWADGLKSAEKNIPILLSSRLGAVEQSNPEKLSKLAAATVSVATTYFADSRVKVQLEAPIQKITPQLVNTQANPGNSRVAASTGLVIKLPKGAKPTAFARIVDEHGREMVSAKDVASAAQAGAPLVRWFKNDVASGDSAATADSPVITGTSDSRGVIKIAASDWKPAYGAVFVSGAAAVVVK
jgi:hypothetical protein